MTWAALLFFAQQSMTTAATQGMAAPTRNAFSAPGSTVARLAASESWHALYWFAPFILIAYVLLVYVMIKFRDRGDGRQPAQFHENNPLEFAWTILPLVVVITVALHSFPVLHYMEYGGNNSALNVEVVGHQFFWEYKYPQYGIDISNDTLVVPANEVVDLDLTSVDVIHGFFVPGLGIQMDALPGRLTNLWFKAKPGFYKGQCTQLCGANHAQMLIEVQVVPNDQFQAWLQAHRSPPAGPAATAPASGAAMTMMKMETPPTAAPNPASRAKRAGGEQ